MEAVRLYRLRWRIEQLFRTLKKDGLDLEATQLEEASRIMKLAALGVIASCRIMQLAIGEPRLPRQSLCRRRPFADSEPRCAG